MLPAPAAARAIPARICGRNCRVEYSAGQLTSVLPSPFRSQFSCCAPGDTSALTSAGAPATIGTPEVRAVTRGSCAGTGPVPGPGAAVALGVAGSVPGAAVTVGVADGVGSASPGSMRTTAPGLRASVNQRLPSAPMVIPVGPRSAVKPGVRPATNSVPAPSVVIRPMAPGLTPSVNHRAPSGPLVIPSGPRPAVVNSVTTPSVVIRP